MMNLRVGIAGAGNIATSRHLPAYQNDDRAVLAGIYDRNSEKSRRVAREYDTEPVESFTALCERSDLVSLCTPPSVHCEQAVEALDAGCHVLAEKPMAMSLTEADEMIAAAETNDRVLSVVQNFLFMPKMREARKLVANGAIGNVNRTYAFLIKKGDEGKEYVAKAEDRGDAGIQFWDESPHMLYLTRAFIGDMTLASADATEAQAGTGYETVRAQFTGNRGATGTISFVWDSPISEWWIAVLGTDGIVLVDIYRDLLLQFDAEDNHSAVRVISVLLSGIVQATVGGFSAGLRYLRDRFVEGYRIPDAGFSYQIHRVIDAIENGTEPPVTGDEAKAILDDMAHIQSASGMAMQSISENSGD